MGSCKYRLVSMVSILATLFMVCITLLITTQMNLQVQAVATSKISAARRLRWFILLYLADHGLGCCSLSPKP